MGRLTSRKSSSLTNSVDHWKSGYLSDFSPCKNMTTVSGSHPVRSHENIPYSQIVADSLYLPSRLTISGIYPSPFIRIANDLNSMVVIAL